MDNSLGWAAVLSTHRLLAIKRIAGSIADGWWKLRLEFGDDEW